MDFLIRLRPRDGNERIRRDYENLEVHPYSPSIEEGDDDEENPEFGSPTSSHLRVPVSVHRQSSNSSRRTDSGVSRGENGDITPRSGSISESSTSPEKGTSESSSGVHSSSSLSNKRASSMENVGLVTLARPTWKSMSLQRGVMPPPVVAPHAKVFRSPNASLAVQRKTGRPGDDIQNAKMETFERATNIRMTSFTEQPDFPPHSVNINYTSKSPQHYPTGIVQTIPTHHRRDSANYSLASSAESEASVQHS